jgi:nitrate reductase gamma subunit
MSVLQLAGYGSIILFVIVVAAKMIKIAKMPIHIRWDLYPIPHERGKGSYGGSYFEELDWWTKPNNFSLFAELKAMALEIIFVQSVLHHNKKLWVFSFPFHFGLYCLCGFLALLVVGALLTANGIAVAAGSSNAFAVIIYYATYALGLGGFILATLGAIGLFFSRLGGELAKASVRSDYFNLIILLAVFVVSIYSWATVDPGFALVRSYVQSLITASPVGALPGIVTTQLWLWVALMVYFPFTHMTHMFGKYFTYHTVRWEDHPNIRGGKIEQRVQEALGYKITWSAAHIKSGGSWADAATAPEEDGTK